MQGARTTRTPSPSRARKSSSNVSPPASAQERLSHTRTVIGGGALSLIHDDVEMRVERGDLVHLGQGELHLFGERHEMARIETAEMVL